MSEIALFEATIGDAKIILEWRNDPVSRRMSQNTRKVGAREHLKWMNFVLKSQRTILLVAKDTKTFERLGAITLYLTEKYTSADISINLNPAHRGQGLGAKCLVEVEKYISVEYPQIKNINAKIRIENTASINTFSRVGYEKVSCSNGLAMYRFRFG